MNICRVKVRKQHTSEMPHVKSWQFPDTYTFQQ